MRIIFLATKLDFLTGGGSAPELDLKIRALQELGHEVILVTLFSKGNKGQRSSSGELIEESVTATGSFAIQRAAYNMLRKYESRADIFHIDGVAYLYAGGWYRLRHGRVPVVAHLNREQSSFPSSRKKIERRTILWWYRRLRSRTRYVLEKYIGTRIANYIDVLTLTSPLQIASYLKFGISPDRMHLVPDFFDAKMMVPQEHAERAPQGRELSVVTSGRMEWEKGLDLVVRAVSLIPQDVCFTATISGDGPEQERLHELARSLGVATRVEFPGWLPKKELFKRLASADIFVLPRWRPELASMLLFEAMAYGLPCIVPAETTLAWSGGNGVATFCVDDPTDLACVILLLWKDRAKASLLGKLAKERLLALDYHAEALRLSELMQKLVGTA